MIYHARLPEVGLEGDESVCWREFLKANMSRPEPPVLHGKL